jgi:hypothetical protein
MIKPQNYKSLHWTARKRLRNDYIADQNNECFYCGDDLNAEPSEELKDLPIDWSLFPENFLQYPVHLQHDHKTGMTEGAVHSLCNAIMWNYFRR